MDGLIETVNYIALSVNVMLVFLFCLFLFLYHWKTNEWEPRAEWALKVFFPIGVFTLLWFIFPLNLFNLIGLLYLVIFPIHFLACYSSTVALDVDPDFSALGDYRIYMYQRDKKFRSLATRVYEQESDEYGIEKISQIIKTALEIEGQLTEQMEAQLKEMKRRLKDVKLFYYYFADYSIKASIRPLRRISYLSFSAPQARKIEGNILELDDKFEVNKKKFVNTVMIEGLRNSDLSTFLMENKNGFAVLNNITVLETAYERELKIKHLEVRHGRLSKELTKAIMNNIKDSELLGRGSGSGKPELTKSNSALIIVSIAAIVLLILFICSLFL